MTVHQWKGTPYTQLEQIIEQTAAADCDTHAYVLAAFMHSKAKTQVIMLAKGTSLHLLVCC